MAINRFARKNKVKKPEFIEESLKALQNEIKVAQGNYELTVGAGGDPGSTETRIVMATSVEKVGEFTEYIIPSIVSNPELNIIVDPKSERLYDRLDSTIMSLGTESSIPAKIRCVRAGKMKQMGITPRSMSSSLEKVKDDLIFINIIDALGYSICMDKNGGAVPATLNVYLGIGLPPTEIQTEKQKQAFITKMVGEYIWDNKNLGVRININIKGVAIQTEPEAFINGYLNAEYEYDEKGNLLTDEQGNPVRPEIPAETILLNAGGRSIGTEYIEDGSTLLAGSRTMPEGGKQLIEAVSKHYVRRTNADTPEYSKVYEALQTGILRVGATDVQITADIKACKDELGNRIFEFLTSAVLDNLAGKTINSVGLVLASGRLFGVGAYDYSVADKFSERLSNVAPGVDFALIEDNFIPHGNFLLACTQFVSSIPMFGEVKEAEVEVAVTDTAIKEVEVATVKEEALTPDAITGVIDVDFDNLELSYEDSQAIAKAIEASTEKDVTIPNVDKQGSSTEPSIADSLDF